MLHSNRVCGSLLWPDSYTLFVRSRFEWADDRRFGVAFLAQVVAGHDKRRSVTIFKGIAGEACRAEAVCIDSASFDIAESGEGNVGYGVNAVGRLLYSEARGGISFFASR